MNGEQFICKGKAANPGGEPEYTKEGEEEKS